MNMADKSEGLCSWFSLTCTGLSHVYFSSAVTAMNKLSSGREKNPPWLLDCL